MVYLDAMNLYGCSMSQYLPQGDFRWLCEEQKHCFKISNESEKVYILKVALKYPHDLHDVAFCPQNMIPPNGNYPELILNLHKENDVIHYQNLR